MIDPTAAYEFELPPELIAQDPTERRGDSRLLLVEPGRGAVAERVFRDLPEVLRPGDLLVLNESRVLPARLQTVRVDSGGRVELLLVRPVGDARTWLAMARPGRRLKPGVRLELVAAAGGAAPDNGGSAPVVEVLENRNDGQFVVQGEAELAPLAEEWGVMPLPPYIRRTADDPQTASRQERDRRRYQTVFAVDDPSGAGSVAAPTAGLHFSDATLSALRAAGISVATVSLHVGPGTFRPPTSEQIANRRLHLEVFHYPAAVDELVRQTRTNGGRVIAVGTTSLRVLETVARLGLDDGGPDRREFGPTAVDPQPAFNGTAERSADNWDVRGATRLFISPPERVTSVDGLLTNFHLPGSSLLMLVSALMGETVWRKVYTGSVEQGFRFYSYGDCMLMLPGLATAGDPGAGRGLT